MEHTHSTREHTAEIPQNTLMTRNDLKCSEAPESPAKVEFALDHFKVDCFLTVYSEGRASI